MKKLMQYSYIFVLLLTLSAQQPMQAVFGVVEGVALIVGVLAAFCCTKKQCDQRNEEQVRQDRIKSYVAERASLYNQVESYKEDKEEYDRRMRAILFYSSGKTTTFHADGSEQESVYTPDSQVSLDFEIICNRFLDNVFSGKKLSTKKKIDSSKVLKIVKHSYPRSWSSNSRAHSRLSDSSAFMGYQTVSSGYDSDDEAELGYPSNGRINYSSPLE
jgi:hypothetical protein